MTRNRRRIRRYGACPDCKSWSLRIEESGRFARHHPGFGYVERFPPGHPFRAGKICTGSGKPSGEPDIRELTDIQARALAALMIRAKSWTHFPDGAELVDGCWVGAQEGWTPGAVAETMNLWWLLKGFTDKVAGKLCSMLVRRGFAARVWMRGERAPRYVATAAGAAEHRRRDARSAA